MAPRHNNQQRKRDLGPQAMLLWVPLLVFVSIGFGLFLLLAPREKEPPLTEKPGNSLARQAPTVALLPGARKTSRGPADSYVALERRSATSPPSAEAQRSTTEALHPSTAR